MNEGSEYLEAKEMEEEGLRTLGFWWLKNGSGREGDSTQALGCPVSKEERQSWEATWRCCHIQWWRRWCWGLCRDGGGYCDGEVGYTEEIRKWSKMQICGG